MALWMVRTGLQPGQHYYHHQLPVDTITKQPLHQYSPYINLLKQFQQHTECHSLPTNFYLCSSAIYFYCTLVRAFTILVGPGIESLAKFKSWNSYKHLLAEHIQQSFQLQSIPNFQLLGYLERINGIGKGIMEKTLLYTIHNPSVHPHKARTSRNK